MASFLFVAKRTNEPPQSEAQKNVVVGAGSFVSLSLSGNVVVLFLITRACPWVVIL